MSCDKLIGVRNVKVSFTECGTGRSLNNVIHKLGSEELPTWRFVDHVDEDAGDGYRRRKQTSFKGKITLKRNARIPSAWYQGKADITVTVEYEDDSVVVGRHGSPTGETMTDRINVELDCVWDSLTEILAAGTTTNDVTSIAA